MDIIRELKPRSPNTSRQSGTLPLGEYRYRYRSRGSSGLLMGTLCGAALTAGLLYVFWPVTPEQTQLESGNGVSSVTLTPTRRDLPFQVVGGDTLTVALSASGSTRLSLITPNGTAITPANAANSGTTPDISDAQQERIDVQRWKPGAKTLAFTVPQPEAGRWLIRMSGGDDNATLLAETSGPGSLKVSSTLNGDPDSILASYEVGDSINLMSSLRLRTGSDMNLAALRDLNKLNVTASIAPGDKDFPVMAGPPISPPGGQPTSTSTSGTPAPAPVRTVTLEDDQAGGYFAALPADRTGTFDVTVTYRDNTGSVVALDSIRYSVGDSAPR